MKKPQQGSDPFIPIAIKIVLGTGLGFSFICFSFILFLFSFLASNAESYETPGWQIFLLGLLFLGGGIGLMYYSLRDTPPPGEYNPPT